MKAIGIDLGTTNSVAAHCDLERRNPRVLSTSSGENLTPSVVSVRRAKTPGEAGEILVGRAALNYGLRAPEETILSIKRLMGRDLGDPKIEQVVKQFNYQVVAGPEQDPRSHVRLADKDYTPAQISAMILRKIMEDAGRALGEPVTHAVITVPAYFNEGQRAATREAGEQAGLVVKKIIDEPTAAAIAFGADAVQGEKQRVLVYDLGGGTFDISILQMVKDKSGCGQFQVLVIEGDNWLGGDDFDRCILERILAEVAQESAEDPSRDQRFLFLARKHAEETKRALSQVEAADVVIPAAYHTAQDRWIDVEFSLSRDEFEAMIAKDVARSLELTQKALHKQNLRPEDITDVLLVGGSTLTPAIYRAVEGLFGADKVKRNVNPMECVALGASLLAASLRGIECPNCQELNEETATECKNESCRASLASARAVGELGIVEVTAMSLGIAAVKDQERDVFVPIIPKGTPYPLREPMKERFRATNERLIKVPVYEGDDQLASRNAEQGEVIFELPQDISPDAEVEVSFNYDRDRQLQVTISIPGTPYFKSETLRRDQPRATASKDNRERGLEDGGAWQDDLNETIEFALRFQQHYRLYMEPGQIMKLERDIERARKLLVFADELEGQRMNRILQMHVFNSGLATQLYLADRATSGASPEESKEISEAAKVIRQLHESGDRAQAAEKARLLKVMVAKQLERQAGVQQIADREDYDGLLKLLGEP